MGNQLCWRVDHQNSLLAHDTLSLRTSGLTGQGAVVINSTTHSDATYAGWQIAISCFGREHRRAQADGDWRRRWPLSFPGTSI